MSIVPAATAREKSMKKIWKRKENGELMLTTVDLFSGIGGFARGLEATGHFRTTCFVEQDPYCQAVLKHHWPDVPILDDIKNAKAFDFPDTRPDLVCGGFPCQPFSQAGRQRAQDDPRHLWPEMLRVIRELRPTWVVGENVVGLIKLGLDEVLTDLEGEGYATRTFNIPACATGAPHLRQRVWVVAHADSESEPDGNAGQRQLGFGFGGQDVANPNRSGQCEQRGSEPVQEEQSASECTGEDVADAQRKREGRRGVSGPGQDKSEDGKGSSSQPRGHGEAGSEDHWISEPAVGRLVNGLPNRVSQLRALGNSIVPQIAQEIGQAIRIAHDVSKEN
jgi:DNA (cytosine-5)-methyltransferase 1